MTEIEMIILVVFAAFGLTMSFLVHLSTFFGSNILNAFPSTGFFDFGLIIVMLPTIFACKKACAGEVRFDFWLLATKKAPTLLKIFCIILAVYVFFNFFITVLVLNEGGVPSVINGQKVLNSHGKIIRELTDDEYALQKAYGKRTSSGHWMLFYCIAFTVLLSSLKEKQAQNIE